MPDALGYRILASRLYEALAGSLVGLCFCFPEDTSNSELTHLTLAIKSGGSLAECQMFEDELELRVAQRL